MSGTDQNLSEELLHWQERLFARSVRRQNRLSKLQNLLGSVVGQDCLEISAGDGMISRELRRCGGQWTTLATSPAARDAVQVFHKEPVLELSDALGELPDQSVDVVVIVDALERTGDDRTLIRECHRVLRTNGWLILTTRRKLHFWFDLGLLRSMLGLSGRRVGMVRPGYTTRDFFEVLKAGFDVPATETYSTCWLESFGMVCEAAANKLAGGAYNMPPSGAGRGNYRHYSRLCTLGSIVYPLMWLSGQIDQVLRFVLPGQNIAAKTKRRVWSERRIPQLVDGRSIAEAALNTKIGTAAPF